MKHTTRILITVGLLVLLSACAPQQTSLPSDELLRLGEQYLLELDYEQALAQFLKVVELEPMNPRGYTGAAEAYLGLGDVDSAVAILEQGFARTGDRQLQERLESLRWDGQALLETIFAVFESGSEEEALAALSDWRGEFRNFDKHTPTLYRTPEGRGVGVYYTEGTNLDAYFLYYGEYDGEQRSGEGFWCSVSTAEAPEYEGYDQYEYFSKRFRGQWENDLPNGDGELYKYGFEIDSGDRSPLVTRRYVGSLSDGLWNGEVWQYDMDDGGAEGGYYLFVDGYITVLETWMDDGQESFLIGEFFEQGREGSEEGFGVWWSRAEDVQASYGIPGIAGDSIL